MDTHQQPSSAGGSAEGTPREYYESISANDTKEHTDQVKAPTGISSRGQIQLVFAPLLTSWTTSRKNAEATCESTLRIEYSYA